MLIPSWYYLRGQSILMEPKGDEAKHMPVNVSASEQKQEKSSLPTSFRWTQSPTQQSWKLSVPSQGHVSADGPTAFEKYVHAFMQISDSDYIRCTCLCFKTQLFTILDGRIYMSPPYDTWVNPSFHVEQPHGVETHVFFNRCSPKQMQMNDCNTSIYTILLFLYYFKMEHVKFGRLVAIKSGIPCSHFIAC